MINDNYIKVDFNNFGFHKIILILELIFVITNF